MSAFILQQIKLLYLVRFVLERKKEGKQTLVSTKQIRLVPSQRFYQKNKVSTILEKWQKDRQFEGKKEGRQIDSEGSLDTIDCIERRLID